VFSRPVIALGSDFGVASLPANATPFALEGCNAPGRGRWVTTSIYRFDLTIDAWPTDLACAFAWNKALRSFDGMPLTLGARAPRVALTTPPVKFELRSIDSAAASAATDGQWSAYNGLKDDKFPETPPDGKGRILPLLLKSTRACPLTPHLHTHTQHAPIDINTADIRLWFSYPAVPAMLASALKLKSCCKRNDAAGRALRVLPCSGWDPEFQAKPKMLRDALELNTSCVTVNIVPGLRAGEVVELVLPVGARYHHLSGPARAASSAFLWGLRRFRIPFRDDFKQLAGPNDAFEGFERPSAGVSYRRVTMWLPHGLANGTRISDLAAVLSLCRYADAYSWKSPCRRVDYQLERPNKGMLLMRVPSFAPREHYRIAVRATPSVRSHNLDFCGQGQGD
jgi:hypothetical protein